MQRISFLSLALIMGLCLHSSPVLGDDQGQNKKDAKDAAVTAHGGGKSPKAAGHVQKDTRKNVTSRGDNLGKEASAIKTESAHRATNTGQTANAGITTQTVERTKTSESRQVRTGAFAVQGNRSNHYNGQWVAGNEHSDWDMHIDHSWNHHDYRWYDGGWLIIETGDDETGSIVSRVKVSLIQQGYYNGHVNDRLGPHTRQAISNYESDKGLEVNGRIDGPLLASLGLE